jgi:hypothetical protein
MTNTEQNLEGKISFSSFFNSSSSFPICRDIMQPVASLPVFPQHQ